MKSLSAPVASPLRTVTDGFATVELQLRRSCTPSVARPSRSTGRNRCPRPSRSSSAAAASAAASAGVLALRRGSTRSAPTSIASAANKSSAVIASAAITITVPRSRRRSRCSFPRASSASPAATSCCMLITDRRLRDLDPRRLVVAIPGPAPRRCSDRRGARASRSCKACVRIRSRLVSRARSNRSPQARSSGVLQPASPAHSASAASPPRPPRKRDRRPGSHFASSSSPSSSGWPAYHSPRRRRNMPGLRLLGRRDPVVEALGAAHQVEFEPVRLVEVIGRQRRERAGIRAASRAAAGRSAPARSCLSGRSSCGTEPRLSGSRPRNGYMLTRSVSSSRNRPASANVWPSPTSMPVDARRVRKPGGNPPTPPMLKSTWLTSVLPPRG